MKDHDGIWYDGFQGVPVGESGDGDETLSLRFLLFFNDETKSAQAHADLFDPQNGAFGLYHLARGEEPVVREVKGPMASYVAVKVSDSERDHPNPCLLGVIRFRRITSTTRSRPTR